MLNMASISGSGCIISDNRILTNAHVVADHKMIRVRRYGDAIRYKAQVLWVSHEADLALLTTEDSVFFDDAKPLKIGALPESQEEVLVFGFPVGGDSLSVTKGVLSRIEHQVYAHSNHYFIAGQIDAAINLGNSGGPVIVDGKVVGVVMQSHDPKSTENIGYMVPAPIVKHFLNDVKDGQYNGYPDLGIDTQSLENSALRQYHHIPKGVSGGVIVRKIWIDSVVTDLIKIGDVLMAIDGHDIAYDGSVEFRPRERTDFSHYVDSRQIGDDIELRLFRQDKGIKDVKITLSSTGHESILVPSEVYDKKPRYVVYGGMVFCPLSKNVLMRWGDNWQQDAPKPLVTELANWATEQRREIVVLLQSLPHDINIGYNEMGTREIVAINGLPFKNFDEFKNLLFLSKDYARIRIDHKIELVLDVKKSKAHHREILDTYNIKDDGVQKNE